MALLKNDDVIRAISGSFALQGIKVVVVMVIILSLWLSIVRAAITPGTPQPVPIIIGINDFPERPNLLSILSVMNAILDIYPQLSSSDRHKNNMSICGMNPSTEPTPAKIPSHIRLIIVWEHFMRDNTEGIKACKPGTQIPKFCG